MEKFAICWGEENYQDYWDNVRDSSVVDSNTFCDGNPNKTVRSKDCDLLVYTSVGSVACANCKNISVRLRKIYSRALSKPKITPHPNKPHKFMSSAEKREKLSQRKIKSDSLKPLQG